MQRTSKQRTRIHSAYNPKEPPPLDAPQGIAEVTAWELASAQWREHLPDNLLGVECAACDRVWPCDAWDIANDVINDCHETADAS